MPIKIAVVCEAEGDFRTGTQLAERVFQQEIEWITADTFRDCPVWHGHQHATPFIKWTEIGKILRNLGMAKPKGHFGNEPIAPDASQARTALIVLQRLHPDLDGVLFLRDDDRAERRIGLEQARDHSPLRDRIVIGLAKSERECWVLAGFEPNDEVEQEALENERKNLGFDPRVEAERLDTRKDTEKRSAKRVLWVLTGGDQEREERCWLATDLDMLRQRGERSGLRVYLDEIKDRFVPLLAGNQRL